MAKTQLVVNGNEWRERRQAAGGRAHPQMRLLMRRVLRGEKLSTTEDTEEYRAQRSEKALKKDPN